MLFQFGPRFPIHIRGWDLSWRISLGRLAGGRAVGAEFSSRIVPPWSKTHPPCDRFAALPS